MKVRTVWAMIINLVDDAIAAAAILWVFPLLGIHLSPYWLIPFALIAGGISLVLFRAGTRALMKEPVIGMTSMVGTRGRVVNALAPEGMVKIGGELWAATSDEGELSTGEKITVVAQDGLSLIVRRTDINVPNGR
ncbi:MAG: NfeD family protein [Chloroflexota bacterium]